MRDSFRINNMPYVIKILCMFTLVPYLFFSNFERLNDGIILWTLCTFTIEHLIFKISDFKNYSHRLPLNKYPSECHNPNK